MKGTFSSKSDDEEQETHFVCVFAGVSAQMDT